SARVLALLSWFAWLRLLLAWFCRAGEINTGAFQCDLPAPSYMEMETPQSSDVDNLVQRYGNLDAEPGSSSPTHVWIASKLAEGRQQMRWLCTRPRWAVLAVVTLLPFVMLEEARRTCGLYESFEKDLDFRWGFLLQRDNVNAAPIWLGEFGTAENSLWWQYLMRYLHEHEVSWAYWPLNGYKYRGEDETYGLLEMDFATVRDAWKLEDLQKLMERPTTVAVAVVFVVVVVVLVVVVVVVLVVVVVFVAVTNKMNRNKNNNYASPDED
ncbi:unnamed protein product, partial [Polarella glacialis]